jgi:hypothetical protein
MLARVHGGINYYKLQEWWVSERWLSLAGVLNLSKDTFALGTDLEILPAVMNKSELRWHFLSITGCIFSWEHIMIARWRRTQFPLYPSKASLTFSIFLISVGIVGQGVNSLTCEIMSRRNRETFDSSANLFLCNWYTCLHIKIEIFGQKLTAKPLFSYLPGRKSSLGFQFIPDHGQLRPNFCGLGRHFQTSVWLDFKVSGGENSDRFYPSRTPRRLNSVLDLSPLSFYHAYSTVSHTA